MSIDIVPRALTALLEAPPLASRRVAGIWLFGSFARGAATPSSDIDLAVLCEPALGLERMTLMEQLGRAVNRDVDIVDLRTADPTLAWEIVTTGRIVFERDPLVLERFVRDARYAAEDAEQRARMILLAQVGSVGGAIR